MARTMRRISPVFATNIQTRFSHQPAIMLKRLEIGSRLKVTNFPVIQSCSDSKTKDWIPAYLQKSTQASLRAEMEKTRSAGDEPGYIYTFEIRGRDKLLQYMAITLMTL